jgi:perosamine synthetase
MINHNQPFLSGDEIKNVKKVINSRNFSDGFFKKNFEIELSKYIGINKSNIVLCSSGSAALYLAIVALGIKNKKISHPAYVCSAVKNAVSLSGNYSEILDIGENGPNLNSKIINSSKSKFCIVPHTYGIPVDLTNVKNKIIIEDCCQALGSKIGSKHVGLFGDISVLSFYSTKLINAGGYGGAVFSRDKILIDRIRDYINFDMKIDKKNRFNLNLGEVNASIGFSQIKKIKENLAIREKIFQRYKSVGFKIMENDSLNSYSAKFRCIILTKYQKEMINFLEKKKIKSINPFLKSELLSKNIKFKNSILLTSKTVSLPIYPSLGLKKLNHIIDNLKEFKKKYPNS